MGLFVPSTQHTYIASCFMDFLLQVGGFWLPFIVMASLLFAFIPIIYLTLPSHKGKNIRLALLPF